MRLHYIQHVAFEGLANIEGWARDLGWEISCTQLYRMEKLPDPEELDWLVVLGGPMNIYEEKEYSWLTAEKKFIAQAIKKNKIVLGICLGAQLIADVLGGRVVRNRHKEIGWFPVTVWEDGRNSHLFRGFPDEFLAFHWHGDTFSLPPGAAMLAESEACPAQAFSFNSGRVLGLQFHLESSAASVRSLIQNCSDELVEGKYIQGPDDILGREEYFPIIHRSMLMLLENMKTL
ncbi:MAG: type 1 glutamine amidotransferase [Syntrophobacteraceae bacterium]